MVTDLPDYCQNIVVAVDIPEIQIGHIYVDIATSAITLDVNIESSDIPFDVNIIEVKGVSLVDPTVAASIPVSIENEAIAYDGTNDRFTVDVEACVALVVTSITNTVTVAVSGTVPVSIAATVAVTQSGTWTVGISGTVPVSIAATVAVTQSGTWTVGISGTVPVSIAATVVVSGTVAISGTVPVSIAATVAVTQSGTWTVGITGTVPVSIAATVAVTQSGTWTVGITGTVPVSIAATVIISGAVTVTSGAITVSGAVTVSTSGGTNIVLDKLTQGAYIARADALYNPYPATPPTFFTNAYYRSKYYPRGCRGYISNIQIRAKNTGAETTMTFGIAPDIGGVDVITFTATIPAGADGTANITTTINKPWEADSMFIHTKTLGTASLGLGYDETGFTDGFYSTDLISWTSEASRAYITVAIVGMSVGDLPVAGIVRLGDRSSYRCSHCAADTQVKASAGRIHTVTINKCTTAGTVTVYDNTAESGTVIAVINLGLNMMPVTLIYDVLCTTGIYVGFDGTVVADITVSYI